MKRANQQWLFNFLSRPHRVFCRVSVLQLHLIHFSICDGRWTIASEHLTRCVLRKQKKSESLRLWYMCSNAPCCIPSEHKWRLHASAMSSNRKVFDRVIRDSTAPGARTMHFKWFASHTDGRWVNRCSCERWVPRHLDASHGYECEPCTITDGPIGILHDCEPMQLTWVRNGDAEKIEAHLGG